MRMDGRTDRQTETEHLQLIYCAHSLAWTFRIYRINKKKISYVRKRKDIGPNSVVKCVNDEVWGSSLAAGKKLQTAKLKSISLIDSEEKSRRYVRNVRLVERPAGVFGHLHFSVRLNLTHKLS